MIITGKKFSKPEMSRVINGDKVLSAAPEKPETIRLDHFLVKNYPSFNRSNIQKFIKEGRVIINGEVIKKPNYQITTQDQITFTPPEITAKHLPKLATIYEDDNVLVVNKPSGMLSMSKGEYNPEPTLEDYGLLVHRLDRGTSGVVILAKNEATQKMLRKQFQDRKAHKTYLAVVQGHPKHEEANLDLPIARNYKHPTTFLVEAGGKESQTYYKVLQKSQHYALLELRPTTGRTHQLRVHLKYIGHPILGDHIYGSESTASRLMLHARELEITIPAPLTNVSATSSPTIIDTSTNTTATAKRCVFTAPAPPEFSDILAEDA